MVEDLDIRKDDISVRCGWLTKQRVFGLGTSRKWCVLRDGILYVFNEKGKRRLN